MSRIPAPRTGVPLACSLVLPVAPDLGPEELIAAVDVLVRTAPAQLELQLVLAADPALATAAPATAAAVAAFEGDVQVESARLPQAAAVALHDLAVVLDPRVRTDLAELPGLLAQLLREADPLPFVHRLGLLVTRTASLAALPADAVPAGLPLPELARLLRPRVHAPEARPSLRAAECAPLPGRPGSISVVVVADAPLAVLDTCLSRLKRHLPSGAEVLVVDPGGDYARSRELRTLRWVTVVVGSGAAPVAAGLRRATGEFVLLLDPGTWVTRRWAEGLVGALRDDPRVAVAAPRTNVALGDQGVAGVGYRDVPGMEAFAEQIRRNGSGSTELPAVGTACVALRRSAVVEAGGWDDAFDDAEIATLDLCLRLRDAGARVVRADDVFVHVAESPRGTRAGRWRFGGGGDLGLLRARHGADADRALPGLVGTVMIVKDEEETVARALESVSGVVDDVVVCDTGSTDGTLALLDACGVRTTTFPWQDDFGLARNASLAEHTGTWALLLDADETLDCPDPAQWRRELAENPTDVVFLVCRNLESGTGGASVDNASSRLLRAADCHWVGRIHEQMVRRDGAPASSSASDGARIIHDGYAVRRVIDRRKVDRNDDLTRRGLADAAAGEDTPAENDSGRAHFERGRAELLAGNPADAEGHFLAAVDLLPDRFELLRRMAYCNLATLANDQGRPQEAIGFARLALDESYAYTQAALALAVAHLRLDGPGDREHARRVLESTVRVGRELSDPTTSSLLLSLRDEGLVYGGAANLLANLLLETGDSARAVEVLLPLVRSEPRLFTAWSPLRRALAEQLGEWPEVLAELAESVPGALEAVVVELDETDRDRLFDALRRRGIEAWQVSSVERTWQQLQPELRRMSGAGLVAAARQQEADNPALALRLWRMAGTTPAMLVGQARCLDALGHSEAAAEVLSGVDVAALEPVDTLFVAALAVDLGDVALAVALLNSLPAGLEPALAVPAQQIRELLGTS